MILVTAPVLIEIFDDEPWRPCGTQTPSGERRKFVSRQAAPRNARSGLSLALSHQRMAVKRRAGRSRSRPSVGGDGRARREP
jgi:hypothetical protein